MSFCGRYSSYNVRGIDSPTMLKASGDVGMLDLHTFLDLFLKR